MAILFFNNRIFEVMMFWDALLSASLVRGRDEDQNHEMRKEFWTVLAERKYIYYMIL
jgi:hypothetical protein